MPVSDCSPNPRFNMFMAAFMSLSMTRPQSGHSCTLTERSFGTTVPQDGGDAVMELKASPTRKYMFSLKFEANPVIEAHTVEEAEAKAYEWMRRRAVVDTCTGDGDEGYVPQEPYFLEEVKE